MSEDPVDLRSLRTADCPGPEVEGNKQLEPLVEAKRIPSHWDSEGLARKAKEIEIGLKCLTKKKEKKRKKKQSSRNQDCFSLMSLPGECLKSLFIWYIFQASFKYLADTYLTHKQESS